MYYWVLQHLSLLLLLLPQFLLSNSTNSSIGLLSFPITMAAIVTTLTTKPTTATDIPPFQEKPGQGAASLE